MLTLKFSLRVVCGGSSTVLAAGKAYYVVTREALSTGGRQLKPLANAIAPPTGSWRNRKSLT